MVPTVAGAILRPRTAFAAALLGRDFGTRGLSDLKRGLLLGVPYKGLL